MNQINQATEFFSQFIGTLFANRTFAVFCSCFVVGFALKKWRQFSNEGIPVVVILWGMAMTIVVDNHHTPEFSLTVEKFIAGMVGMVNGFCAWMFHLYLFKPLLKRALRIPFLAQFVDDGGNTKEYSQLQFPLASGDAITDRRRQDQAERGRVSGLEKSDGPDRP